MPGTVRLHRVLVAAPEAVFRAFVEPDAIAQWLPPKGFLCTVETLEAVPGGQHRMAFRAFASGHRHSFGGTYLEVVPGQRLRYTTAFDTPDLSGDMVTTITLTRVSVGAELQVVQEGIPDAIPPEACSLGWQDSLENLARLVEAKTG
ncbi:MAG: SRPBCC family protein [Proteobacteria bacterium]|nr:SRPBCC family protein [Pseudomonadota bacterium]